MFSAHTTVRRRARRRDRAVKYLPACAAQGIRMHGLPVGAPHDADKEVDHRKPMNKKLCRRVAYMPHRGPPSRNDMAATGSPGAKVLAHV
jgi:hypothetical protein